MVLPGTNRGEVVLWRSSLIKRDDLSVSRRRSLLFTIGAKPHTMSLKGSLRIPKSLLGLRTWMNTQNQCQNRAARSKTMNKIGGSRYHARKWLAPIESASDFSGEFSVYNWCCSKIRSATQPSANLLFHTGVSSLNRVEEDKRGPFEGFEKNPALAS